MRKLYIKNYEYIISPVHIIRAEFHVTMLLLPLYFIKINISESKYLVMIGGITRVRIKNK